MLRKRRRPPSSQPLLLLLSRAPLTAIWEPDRARLVRRAAERDELDYPDMLLQDRVLVAHRSQLEAVARALLEHGTLSGDDIGSLLAGKAPLRSVGG